MRFPHIRAWGSALVLAVLLFAAIGAMDRAAHAQPMRASFYGAESGRRTASGQPFHPEGFSAAHRSLAFGTRLRVCLDRCVMVVVNDRGPFVGGRDLDLSHGAARAIGLTGRGVATIAVDRLN